MSAAPRLRAALVAAALLAVALPNEASAQKAEKVPPRPKLETGADTNDALAYYRFGTNKLRRDPESAENAFYWASRIAPSWADPYYGRWAAVVLQRRNRPSRAERAHADSLDAAAARRNPFLFRRLDLTVLEGLAERAGGSEFAGDYMFDYTSNNGDPVNDGFNAYQASKFADAARLFGKAIEKNAKNGKRSWLHESRALAFYQLQNYDSAAVEIDAFIAAARAREDTSLGYLSKAFAEYQLGSLHLLRGDTAAARAAFGRALSEDLSYAPAHTALSGIAPDPATALAEAEAAAQAQDQDPVLHYNYARTLIATGRADDAERELKRAQELEPWFALPYFMLARMYDASGMEDEAATQYAAYLSHGARMMQEYGIATARLAALHAAPAPAPAAAAAGKGG